jgi:hypothetical protein
MNEWLYLAVGILIGVQITLLVCAVLQPSEAFWRGYLRGGDVTYWWRRLTK